MSQYVRHKKSTNVVSPYKRSSWVNKGYTEEEAAALVVKYQENNSKINKLRSPRTLQHWIDKGYDNDTAKYLLSAFQDNRSLSKLEMKLGSLEAAKAAYTGNISNLNRSLSSGSVNTSVRTLQYWLDCGFSFEDASDLLKNVQSRSLCYFIEKYGSNIGLSKYKQWTEQTISTNGSVSKESIDFFESILACIPDNKSEVLYGTDEYILEHPTGFYKYDFTIPSKSVIIEYHGVAWHPKLPDSQWKHPYGLYTAKEKYELDAKKILHAKTHGFKVIVVFSDENKTDATTRILKELNIDGTN